MPGAWPSPDLAPDRQPPRSPRPAGSRPAGPAPRSSPALAAARRPAMSRCSAGSGRTAPSPGRPPAQGDTARAETVPAGTARAGTAQGGTAQGGTGRGRRGDLAGRDVPRAILSRRKLPGSVRVVAVRLLSRHLAIRPGRGLTLAERRLLTERRRADRALSVLGLPVRGRPVAGFGHVPRLTGLRPRLSRPGLRCLARPRRGLRPWRVAAARVSACHAALARAGRHGASETSRSRRPGVCPLRGRRVSRRLPDGHGSRPRLRWRLGRLSRPGLGLARVCLPGVPRVRRLGRAPGGTAGVTGRRSRHRRVVGAGRARSARRRGALRARRRRPWPGAGRPGPRPAHPGYRVIGPLPRAAVYRGIEPGLPG